MNNQSELDAVVLFLREKFDDEFVDHFYKNIPISEVQTIALKGNSEMMGVSISDMIKEVFPELMEPLDEDVPSEFYMRYVHDPDADFPLDQEYFEEYKYLTYGEAVTVIKYWNNKLRDKAPADRAQRIASDKIANFERYTGKLLLIKKELKDCYDKMIKVLESIE